MRKKVVLFYPKLDMKRRSVELPLSLIALVGPLREAGYDAVLIDERVEENPGGLLLDSLKGAVCLGISTMTGPQILRALEAARVARGAQPDIPIVWGGWHPTILPEQTAQSPFVDAVVRGQGEVTFVELVRAFDRGSDLGEIKGITWREDGKICSTPDHPMIPFDEIAPTAFDILDMAKYRNPRCSVAYSSSYGCPFRCGFCANYGVYGRRWVGASAERVLEDLSYLVGESGLRYVEFVDTNFFIDRKRLAEICRGILDRGLGIKWSASVRAEQILRLGEEGMALAVESGFDLAALGLESGSPRILEFIDKGETVEDALRCAEVLHRYGVDLFGTYIVGFPDETPEDRKLTMKQIEEIRRIHPGSRLVILYYTPYPGTPIYDLALKRGLREPQSLEEWAGFVHDDVSVPWLTEDDRREISYFVTSVYAGEFRRKFEEFRKEGIRTIVFYGAGDTARVAHDNLPGSGLELVGVADGSPRKRENQFLGYKVVSKGEIPALRPDCVVISSYGFQDEIYDEIKDLEGMGIKVRKLYDEDAMYL
ncbi:MAG: B12-binding domain-containing radical SAM protein [bacterium]